MRAFNLMFETIRFEIIAAMFEGMLRSTNMAPQALTLNIQTFCSPATPKRNDLLLQKFF